MHGLAIVDLETTDLKPGFILEIACILTDHNLLEISRFHTLVRPPGYGSKAFWDDVNDFVTKMHSDNGLWEALEGDDAKTEPEARDHFWSFLKEAKDRCGTVHFMGNSIASLDLPFMQARMPEVFENVHYRSIDVSGLQLALETMEGKKIDFPKDPAHRAMSDVKQCIRQFKFLKDRIDVYGRWRNQDRRQG